MIALIVILVIIVVIALAAVASYNGFVSQRNAVQNAWADIDTELKRRYDLIPNLVSTVQGYAAHERGGSRRSRRPDRSACRRRGRLPQRLRKARSRWPSGTCSRWPRTTRS